MAAYKDKPDLSLYHYLKTTATIASCLYQLKIPGEDLNLNQILKSFQELDKTKLQKDRRWTLLLPLIQKIRESLQNIEKEIDKILLKAHRGRLSVILASYLVRVIDFHK